MANVDAVILDLGNVLVFHDNAYLFRRFADVAGLKGDEQAVMAKLDRTLWDRINRGALAGDAIRKEICAALGVELEPALFFAIWNSHFRIHDEVLPIVESLIGRVKLALLSNTNDLHAQFLLPQLPLLQRFDSLLLSHELETAKPDPDFFYEALERLDVPAERAAFFDDIQEYVEAAQRLGIHGRLFTTASQFKEQLRELGL